MYTKRNPVGLSRQTVMYSCLILALVLSSPGELRAVIEPTAGDQAPQSQTQDHILYLPYVSRKTCTYCYYVDSVNGSDSNPGTSTSKPWRTLDKVNASYASFRPGSWIHFKRGSSWTGSLPGRWNCSIGRNG